MQLTDPVTQIHYIGVKTAPKLQRLGIHTIRDLLMFLPYRYDDARNVTPMAQLTASEAATIRGKVTMLSERKTYRRRRLTITQAELTDATGTATLVWFGNRYITRAFTVGDEIYVSGTPKQKLLGFEFQNPEWEKVKEEQIHTARIIPFYNLTAGVSQKQLRFLIHTGLREVGSLEDSLPTAIRGGEKLTSLAEAVRAVHFPETERQLAHGIERLKFEELFWMQLKAEYGRQLMREMPAAAMLFNEVVIRSFVDSLPFTLTRDQKKAAWELLKDLEQKTPTHRLIQGDVGSGKTVVVAIAILNAALSGFQSTIMAPTEVLALQHYETIRKLFAPFKISIGLLTAKHHVIANKKATKQRILTELREGSLACAIGTHALIQDNVLFKKLGLVVIDEQHRFGVRERRRLLEISQSKTVPHLVSLTATPIPRTLALTMYGDLDISTIREKPVGRKPITTKVVSEANRTAAYAFIKKHLALGEQAFFICPLINESDALEVKSVASVYEHLRTDVFPRHTIRFLHGKLKAAEKKKILEDFKRGTFPLLVSTTVIEVGIDIPHATVMVIEGAERFGLAQLHQIRGRVGRSDKQSYCLLFTGSRSKQTLARLTLVTKHQDGFMLAEEDLKLRGEGEVFGTRQSGLAEFSVATIHDTDLIKRSRAWVDKILSPEGLALYREVAPRLEEAERVHFE